jgi:ribonuclease HI
MKSFSAFLREFKVEVPAVKDTLGIPREEMPQVKSDDYDDLIAHLKKNGIKMQKRTVKASSLKASQKNFNTDKIVKAIEKIKTLGKAKPIIVSSDNYVIDGHHRWLAAKNVDTNIDVMQASVKVDELMKKIHSFPKSFSKTINQ